ncbi:hypothetical protein MyNCGM152_32460 [Achromobacter xylosoxidans]
MLSWDTHYKCSRQQGEKFACPESARTHTILASHSFWITFEADNLEDIEPKLNVPDRKSLYR